MAVGLTTAAAVVLLTLVLVPQAAFATAHGGGNPSVPLSAAPAVFDASTDTGSLYNVDRIIRADAAWKAGYTGKGIDVALIDSGVSPVPGLTSGNVLNGPDLSFDSQYPHLSSLDGFGHGTHMASIIAGRDTIDTPAGYAYASPSRFYGVAPDARIINMKVGAYDGSVDVSQVIAAITWVTQHAHDPGFNIRVISLSYGTDATQRSQVDPLAFAVEQAWKAGIVVVAAGGNDGTPATVLADPGYDPYVLAVGADDPQNTVPYADDTVPDFTSRGTNDRHVDVVAPGAHVAGLRDPGSVIDLAHPTAVVADRFIRGSGTSQATAVVAGAAALLLQEFPTATPNQIKRQLMSTAHSFASTGNIYRGQGIIDVYAAVTSKINTSNQSAQFYGTGTGSLELARGSAHVDDGTGALTGEQDIFGAPWNPVAWAAAAASSTAWSGNIWNGNTWTGRAWSGSDWSGRAWSDASWTGRAWSGSAWTGGSWTGRAWSGSTWTGSVWADAVWQ